MPEMIDWRSDAEADVVRRAVKALAEGQLVAFPTEATYAVAASVLVPDAVARLGGAAPDWLTVAVRDGADAGDWVPAASTLGWRLAGRCWPGPLELVWSETEVAGPLRGLPEAVQKVLGAGNGVGVRAPAHVAFQAVLDETAGPIVFRGSRGGHEAVTAAEVVTAEGDRVGLVIDDGPTHYRQAATAVRVRGAAWEIVREGIVPADLLARLSSCIIVFVCTGNTCRSPMAEALFKKLLAERLACQPAELPQRGYVVQSAGLSAMPGGPAADEAVEVAGEFGADLRRHVSQPVTSDLVADADHLVAMTHSHLALLERYFPGLDCRPRLLSAEGDDVPDPVGCSPDVYRACAQLILQHLQQFLPEVHSS